MQQATQHTATCRRGPGPIYAPIRPSPFACARSAVRHLSIRNLCRDWANGTCVEPIRKLSGASAGLVHVNTASLHPRSAQLSLLRAPVMCKPSHAQDDAIARPILSGQVTCGVFVAAKSGGLDPDFEFRFSGLFRFSVSYSGFFGEPLCIH